MTQGTFKQAYHHSIEGCLAEKIGEFGLSSSDYETYISKAQSGLEQLRDNYNNHSLALLDVPAERADLEELTQAYEKLIEGASLVIFLGIGGSSLGGQTIAQFGGWFIPGDMRSEMQSRPRTRFFDNLDPRTLESAFKNIDLKKTRFVATSKSGNTAETLSQLIIVFDRFIEAGLEQEIANSFLVITEPRQGDKKNGLRDLCDAYGIPALDHNTGVGGRFSCLTNVGLSAAVARKMDAGAIREGAQQVVQAMLSEDAHNFAPACGAAAAIGLAEQKSVHNMVMMPYADRLARLSDWYVQLWAESLGKSGHGTTPVKALGPVDQHSQLQLYMDGPRDFMITFLTPQMAQTGPIINEKLAKKAGLDYLAGQSVGDLVSAQQQGVAEALMGAGRPVRNISFPRLDEQALGAILMHFMLETIIAAHIIGIDPFDQPAVEVGKKLAIAKLQNAG